MKMRWIYLSLLLIISCTEHQNNRYDTQNNYSVPNTHSNFAIVPVKTRVSSTANINMDCVKTEGDYETDSHCIRISNVGDRTKSSEVYFDIIDKNASHKERHKGRIWDWISKKGNLYIYMDFKRKIVVSYMRLTGEMIMPRIFASGIVNVSINT